LWKAGFEYLGNNHSEFNEEPNNLRELSSQDQGDVEVLISDNGGSVDYAPMLDLISMHCSLT
jgi:hypothetical protein